MPRTAVPRFSLVRKLIRCSWNPQNLYNMSQKTKPLEIGRGTVFQQKWQGKKESRAYHGEHLREKQLLNQLDLDLYKKYSSYSAHLTSENDSRHLPRIFSLTYAFLERRLDYAVFRALFASSIYQARRMILAKKVKVNGQVVSRPYKELHPGDVFSVEPSAVIKAVSQPQKRPGNGSAINWLKIGQTAFTAKRYMAPFAFVPEYLQVAYNTCSAVYIRHPRIQHGRTEIPSPVSEDLLFKAFSYYVVRRSTRQSRLQRRKKRLPLNWGAEQEFSPVNYAEIFNYNDEESNHVTGSKGEVGAKSEKAESATEATERSETESITESIIESRKVDAKDDPVSTIESATDLKAVADAGPAGDTKVETDRESTAK